MAVKSLGQAKLKSVLKAVRSFHADGNIDSTDANDFFAGARLAGELSLYGSDITETLAAEWEQLTPAQQLLAVMVAEKAPSPAMTPLLGPCTRAGNGYYMRVEATSALASAESDVALPILKDLADDGDESIRKAALKALHGMDRFADLDLLERRLADDDPGVRTQAVQALGAIPGNRSTNLLLGALDDKQMGVALAARKHLVARKDERDLTLDMLARLQEFGTKGRYRLPYAIEVLGQFRDPRGIEVPAARLRKRLADEDSDFFREKFHALYATLVDPAALEAMQTATAVTKPATTHDTPAENSFEASRRRGEEIDTMTDEEVVAYARAQQDFQKIHDKGFQRLLDIDTTESSMQLRRFLKARSIYGRCRAAKALEGRGIDLSPHDRLAIAIGTSRREPVALEDYAEVLGDVLQETMIDETYCSEEMISTLWASGHPYRVAFAIRWLGVNINGKKYGKVAFNCLKSEPAVSEAPVLDALVNPPKFRKPDERQLALLLGKFKCKDALEPIIARLNDPDATQAAQQSFAEALGFIGDPRAIPALMKILPTVMEGPALRKVIEALARLDAREAISAIAAREIKNPKLEPVREEALAKLCK